MDDNRIKEILTTLIESDSVIDSNQLNQLKAIVNEQLDNIKITLEHDKKFNDYFVAGILDKFKQVREEFYTSSTQCENYKLNVKLQVVIYNLINKLAKYMDCSNNKVSELIESKDRWLRLIGFELVRTHVSENNNELLDSTFKEMRSKGVNENPYKAGMFLASCLERNSSVYNIILVRYEHEKDNFKQAILKTFTMVEELPLKVENFILKTINNSQGGIRSLAVLGAGNCKKNKKEAIEILVDELDSQYWYVRGNAATSLAKLQVTDRNIIDKISKLLSDTEGCDWCAQESAINALAKIGKKAKFCIPKLLKLLASELQNDCDESLITDICEALGEIDDGSKEVIDALIQVVRKCEDIAQTCAIRVLGTFGKKSIAALPYLKVCLINRKDLEDDYFNDESGEIILQKALMSINGEQN